MRVTLVCPFDPFPHVGDHGGAHVGGVERVFGEVSRRLAALGHDVTLICSRPGATATTVEEGVRVVRARRHLTILRAPLARLAREIPRDSDVVHVAATYPFTTPAVLRRARRLGIPSVLDFHFEPGPGTPLGRLAAGLYRQIGPSSYPWADAVLVRSIAYGRTARSLSLIPEERWRVVPNGIDPQRFRPTPHEEEGYALFVGRLVPYKGVDIFLKALAHGHRDLPAIVAGEGPLRKKLEALARSLDLSARFIGYVPEEDLPKLYSGAAVTVLPSVTQQEAFGLALLESMACGTPVVASALPGVEEVALTGGLVARPGDPVSLSEELRRSMQPGLLPRGATLSKRVHQTYSWDAVTKRLVEVYEEVVAARAAASPFATEVTTPADPLSQPLL